MDYKDRVDRAIALALEGKRLTPEVLAIPGYSSPRNRILLNALCEEPGTRYLEVGVYCGGSFCAACCDNAAHLAHATAIDNWSQVPDKGAAFRANVQQFVTAPHTIIEGDSFAVDTLKLAAAQMPYDVFFYDGDHSAQAQERALTYYSKLLTSTFIYVCDDWNWPFVRVGTERAISNMGLQMQYRVEFQHEQNDKTRWWNGLLIGVFTKRGLP